MSHLATPATKSAEPEAVYAMEVETGKAVASNVTFEELGISTGKWDANLCDCFSSLVPNCLMVTFCPCVSLAQISHRLNVAPYLTVIIVAAVVIALEWIMFFVAVGDQVTLGDDDYGYDYYYYAHRVRTSRSANVVYRIVSIAVQIVVFVFVWHLRRLTRERFQIPGSGCEDCLVSFFCSCCSTAQIATHIKSYKVGSCDFGAPDMLPAYPSVSAA